ncbi:MAG: hypothetical protein JWP31_2481 [Aeromicrobium sp.]|nr:hypothetical protein [Aeromicrobium sp.]
MSDVNQPPSPGDQPAPPTPPPSYSQEPPAYSNVPQDYAPPAPAATHYSGSLGKIRPTGTCILLAIVTLGIYSYVWYYKTHEEMKEHSGQGIGGLVAFLLAFFIGIASPFLTSSEVGALYKRAGRPEPVSAVTGLWYIPGILILVGPIVWFVKTNGALNKYWESQGATA